MLAMLAVPIVVIGGFLAYVLWLAYASSREAGGGGCGAFAALAILVPAAALVILTLCLCG